jgi:hypothetical protein
MKRNKEELKMKKCKVKDINRHTWCTYEHFSNVYESVYSAMAENGVAVKLDETLMYDKDGNETTNPAEMVGRPTQYKMVRPEKVLFVDETGCNTNMKQDGHVGGKLFVLPVEDYDCGVSGVVTDMHFSVLCFTSGTGQPVLCAVILKSNTHISDIPISWKMGIDIQKDIKGGAT